MLIAQLTRYYPFGGSECLYAGCDPFDHELLTQWHETIKQVDEDLQELPQQWGLNLAAYAGESDVPHRNNSEEQEEYGIGVFDLRPVPKQPGSDLPCYGLPVAHWTS